MRWKLLLGITLVLAGCSPAKTGWTPIAPQRWSRHRVKRLWVSGIVLGTGLDVPRSGRGELFRARLANPAAKEADAALGSDYRWTVPAGGFVDIEAPTGARLTGAADLIVGEPRFGRPVRHAPLLVVVVVDTLRADHVNPTLTPRITDAFATGLRFAAAQSNAPWTLPSMASCMASQPVLSLSLADGTLIALPGNVASWPSALAEAGWTGGAIVANYTVHVQNGFARGFTSFSVPSTYGSTGHPDATWVVAEGQRWLAAHRGEPGFLYLHLMDPHEPYRDHGAGLPPAPDLRPLAHRQRRASPREATLLRRLYAGEVAHVDEVLGPFLATLPASATVVLTADHGESLGEHGAWGHGLTLYHEELAVPLMLRGPRVSTGVVHKPVQLLDLGPTILDLVGVAKPAQMRGVSLLKGGSDEPILASTFGAGPLRWGWRIGRWKLLFRTAHQPGVTLEPTEAEPLPAGAFAYDLQNDPGEDRPQTLSAEQRRALTTQFANSAGRLVPGLQLLIAGVDGAVSVEFESSAPLELTQVFAGERVEVSPSHGRRHWAIVAAAATPLIHVAWTASEPVSVRLGPSTARWLRRRAGDTLAPADLQPPKLPIEQGAALWWDSGRELVISGEAETMERLRALGYIQ